jgi:excisionase family DNA binding protein
VSVRVEVELNGVRVPVVLDDDALATIAVAVPAVPLRDGEQWPQWMSVETASRYLDVPPERLRKLKERREIPFHQEGVGCRVFFARRDLDEWMHEFRHEARRDAMPSS